MFGTQTRASEAALVAEVLFHSNRGTHNGSKFSGTGDARRGRELVESRGCVSCHTVKQDGKQLAEGLKSPQFTSRAKGRPIQGKEARTVKFDPNMGCLARAPGKALPNLILFIIVSFRPVGRAAGMVLVLAWPVLRFGVGGFVSARRLPVAC